MHTMAPSHITIDEKGVARIEGTGMKVIHVAGEKRYRGLTPDEMKQSWPDLSLAQIYAALAYYYAHQAELDAEMDRNDAESERLRAENPNPLTRAELEQRVRERGG